MFSFEYWDIENCCYNWGQVIVSVRPKVLRYFRPRTLLRLRLPVLAWKWWRYEKLHPCILWQTNSHSTNFLFPAHHSYTPEGPVSPLSTRPLIISLSTPRRSFLSYFMHDQLSLATLLLLFILLYSKANNTSRILFHQELLLSLYVHSGNDCVPSAPTTTTPSLQVAHTTCKWW